ncbi:MAG: bifunctional ADP-dependent (S)-NAD(P)H-hydrate dehydratase/NAD(P)H-hydrate epimerase, partial [Actinomycetota bacterium]|nr:bifunctional ADP-dependent (S)-NAD(P)H-hydrate dehydratase/NAD(P)H-hydrate epimerase [Actinomycetota bacterium]
MILAYTAEQVRAAEKPMLAAESGYPGSLMERASFALAVRCARWLRERRGKVVGARVVALVGTGNNGGDALHAGARLARRGAVVDAVLLAPDKAHAGGLGAFRAAG